MKVIVRTIGALKSELGGGELTLELAEDGRVRDLLAVLAERGGIEVRSHVAAHDDARVPPALRVLVNGRDTGVLQGRDTVLRDGDDVLILTPLAGG